MIQLNGRLEDFLRDIGPHTTFQVRVEDEDVFGQEFERNAVLSQVVDALSAVHSVSLGQVLRLGGYQLCEAGINVNRHGVRGGTKVRLHVGNTGVVHVLESRGSGFDVEGVLRMYRQGAAYYQYQGAGFRSFERPHVVVAFADEGRTVMIKATAAMASAYYDSVLDEPVEALNGRTMRQAFREGTLKSRQVVEETLARMSAWFSEPLESPEWGYCDIAARLRERLLAGGRLPGAAEPREHV